MKTTIYQTFLYSILRHLLTVLTGFLVSKGWVDAETADEFTTQASLEIAAGLIALGGALYWSYKDKIMAYVKIVIAKLMPPDTEIQKIETVAATVENKRAVALSNVEPSGIK